MLVLSRKLGERILVPHCDLAVTVVISDPFNLQCLDDLRVIFQKEVKPVLSESRLVLDAINRVYERVRQDVMSEISDESERSLRKALESGRFREVNEPFEVGEVSFHSGWTFHHTGANTSDRARAVMTVIYMADGIRLIEPRRKQHVLDWEAFMPGVQPGEVVDSPLNPVLN